MKNSEVFEIAPIAVFGTHPPLGVVVVVSAIMWKITVALPLFRTVTLSEFGVRLAAVSWNLVWNHAPVESLFFQSSLSPTCG
jgi:hypothetical protein